MITLSLNDVNCNQINEIAYHYANAFIVSNCVVPILMIGLEHQENVEKKEHFYKAFKTIIKDFLEH